MDTDAKLNNNSVEEAEKSLTLSRAFTFWFSFASTKAVLTREDYESEIKVLGSISTVEDFWSYYQHMVRPEKMPVSSKFALFQEGIKPAWEDKENQNGGSFILKVKKNFANKFWEDLLLSYIGEQCEYNDDVCGIILNVKATEVVISVWTKSIDEQAKETIENWLRRTLGLSDKVPLQYRYHPRNKGDSQPQLPQGPPVGHSGQHQPYGRKFERSDRKESDATA